MPLKTQRLVDRQYALKFHLGAVASQLRELFVLATPRNVIYIKYRGVFIGLFMFICVSSETKPTQSHAVTARNSFITRHHISCNNLVYNYLQRFM